MPTELTATIGNTPLLTLNNIESPAILLAKQESRNPMGSVKCRVAYAMIEAAIKEGKIGTKTTVVEPTSGNTGLGLAFVCAQKKIPLILTMSESMSLERRLLLKHLGAELILTPATEGMTGSIRKAEEIVAEKGDAFMPDQFSNPANPEAHRRTTGPEIWRDADGRVDYFVAGVGTGGTLTGVAEVLKAHNPAVRVVAVEPAGSPVLSGGKPGSHNIQGIGAGFIPSILNREIIDEVIAVEDDDAFAAARMLAAEEGILCGISSGAACHAALQIAVRPEAKGKTIVMILPDTGERYLSTGLMEK